MNLQFKFARLPEIIFRPGALSEVTRVAVRYGKKAVLISGKKSFISSTAGSRFLQDIDIAGMKVDREVIDGEPSPEMIDSIVSRNKINKPDVIIAIGGGSVLDAGKAVSGMLTVDGSVSDYLEDVGTREHPGTKIPFIAVPTTSGTGSEATKNAVITSVGVRGFKKSLRHENFVPDFAVIDPELTLNCPPYITAASGMDCFTQLLEAFLSVKAVEYTDALALQGIKMIKTSLVKSYTNGSDIEARTGMSFAALTSGICLANAGLGTVHGFASSIGGIFDIPHGIICGTLMAEANKMNVKKLRASGGSSKSLEKYATLGRIFIDETGHPDEYYIDGFIDYLHELTSKLELPGLESVGFDPAFTAAVCHSTDNKNNPVRLDHHDLVEILSARLK